jgi:predicted dehydrogenase
VTRPFRTLLVGLGRIGAGYSDDPLVHRFYRFASHAQVLHKHPDFAWEAAVDWDESALVRAKGRWGLKIVSTSIADVLDSYDPEIVVLAIPPAGRTDVINACPNLRAVVCEKPLGDNLSQAREFLGLCKRRGIDVQVNLWRRCDEFYSRLASGELAQLIGAPQIVHGIYGNGLVNNGTHILDLFRMLFGEITQVQSLGPMFRPTGLPIADDFNVACSMMVKDETVAVLQPLDFNHYRENAVDIWGRHGRLEILNEGLTIRISQLTPHRALTGEHEIAADLSEPLVSKAGEALYRIYDNLAAVLRSQRTLASSGASALQTARVVEAIRQSAESGGKPYTVELDDKN